MAPVDAPTDAGPRAVSPDPRAATDSALHAIRDPAVRRQLLGLIEGAHDALDTERVDVVLLAARRMACVYGLLRENGLPAPTRGTVVSDRFLALHPPQDWDGKRVLVLDDTRVTGATLDARLVEARALVGPDGEVLASVALDFGPDAPPSVSLFGVEPMRVYQVRHKDGLHNQFARAFGDNLLPYFTDFPMTTSLRATAEQFDRLLTAPEWLTVDVTNSAAAGSGARAYSLFPTGDGLAAVRDALRPCAELLEIVKLRVFSADDGSTVNVRLVPLVLTGGLDAESLRACFDALGHPLSDDDRATGQAAAALSFLLSRALLDALRPLLAKTLDQDIAEDDTFGQFTFGPALHARLAEWSRHGAGGPLELVRPVEGDRPWQADGPDFGWDHAPAPYGPFLVLGDDAVFPSFERLRASVRAAGGVPGWPSHASALGALADASGGNRPAASLAVDVLNDLGYAVPGYYCSDGAVRRGYRQGEAHMPDDLTDLAPGRLGGQLASVPETLDVPVADDPDAELAPRPVARRTQ